MRRWRGTVVQTKEISARHTALMQPITADKRASSAQVKYTQNRITKLSPDRIQMPARVLKVHIRICRDGVHFDSRSCPSGAWSKTQEGATDTEKKKGEGNSFVNWDPRSQQAPITTRFQYGCIEHLGLLRELPSFSVRSLSLFLFLISIFLS
jgi:hypothetical protein